jgi:hypothetical protein
MRRLYRSRRTRTYLLILSLVWLVLTTLAQEENLRIWLVDASRRALDSAQAIEPFVIVKMFFRPALAPGQGSPPQTVVFSALIDTMIELKKVGPWVLVAAGATFLAAIPVGLAMLRPKGEHEFSGNELMARIIFGVCIVILVGGLAA